MFTVWKYELATPIGEYDIPEGARFLAVGTQGLKIVVWALVDTEKPAVKRGIAAVNTGRPAPSDDEYIGTVLIEATAWHVFVTSRSE